MSYQWMNRAAMISNIVREKGVPALKKMLEELSSKELWILRKTDNADLLDAVTSIAKAPFFDLIDRLTSEFGLEVSENQTGVFVDTKPIRDRLPEEFKNSHLGWWFDSHADAAFEEWLRCFFLQEIRVNIWSRYITHKEEEKKGTNSVGHHPPYDPTVWSAYAGYS